MTSPHLRIAPGAVAPAVTPAVEFFARDALNYREHTECSPAFAERFDLFARWIRHLADEFGPGATCIDLGCGPGTLALTARRCGFEVVAVDGSASMLSLARMSAHESHLELQLMQEQLPLPCSAVQSLSASAHVVLASSVIEYIEDDAAFLRQCRSLLRPNGYLLASFPNRRSVYNAGARAAGVVLRQESYLHVQKHRYEVRTVVEMLAAAAFETTVVEFFGLPALAYRCRPPRRRHSWLATLFLVIARALPPGARA